MGIPHLLVAPKVPIGPQLPTDLQPTDADEGEIEDTDKDIDRSIYNLGTGDFRGRYEDGAYIGQPDWEHNRAARNNPGDPKHGEEWKDPDEEDAEAALCDAYYVSLRNRYALLRQRLQVDPPASAVAALPNSNGFYVGHLGPKSSVFAVWNRRLRDTDPSPAQVASLEKDAVIRVLRVMLSGTFLRRGYDLSERTSRWLWALLARLPDRGEMNHVEIGWVRDLGRRAVLMTQSLTDMANLREALEGEGMDLGVHEAVDESSDDDEALQDMDVVEEEGAIAIQSYEDVSTNSPPDGDAPLSKETPENRPDALEASEETQLPPEDDQKSEAMDCSEDGEVADDEPTTEEPESLEAAKARILAQLDQADATKEEGDSSENRVLSAEDQLRARLNMRATLNMILTVAGEFYGQRDLLEFRDPFPGM